MNIDYVNFYNNFVELCKEKGLKPSRAGIEAGIPKQTVSNWKAGRKPSDTYIAQLADYFGVPVSYFSEESPTEKETSTMRLSIAEENLIRLYRTFSIEEKINIQAYLAAVEEAKREKQ